MGAAAYRRGSRAISRQIDRELAERRQICGGTYRSGPDKAYGYCDRCGRVDYEKYEGDKCTMPPKGAWPRDNPVTGGGVALAALVVAGVAWLFLRPKKAAATTSDTTPVELPSFTPSSTPAPQPVATAGSFGLNCPGKVRVTYKFKDSPLLLNVFRRLTTWAEGKTPDSGQSFEDRIWAPTTTSSFFAIGVQASDGWINSTKLENDLKDVQMQFVTKRYFAEAWIETTDGWCLAATDTNYEPWVK